MNTGLKDKSLEEVNSSVDTTQKKGFWRKLFSFLGPAYLVSVGYMDPGNWATDIAGGSQFGYSLLWVLLMSNLMALLLQSLSARLGLVTGLDLAQASRANYPKLVNFSLYFLAEIAIAACDLAEVLGMAIGLQLLFDIPLLFGVTISVLDTFLLLFLMNYGIRKMEAFIVTLVAIIGLSFLAEMFFAEPSISAIAHGLIPSIPSNAALYIAIGIIGATVMPHNLYLHSSLVQTRKIEKSDEGIKKAIRFNFIDSAIALNFAFFVNAAILILAAAVFFKNGMFDVVEIQDAHRLLSPVVGNHLAPTLFAIALIAAGQSSTITGTLAGQIIMEGYLNLRIQPWIRRLATRIIAIVPAYLTISLAGEEATGRLLIFSQVVLSLQLGFAVIPLIHFVSNKKRMGSFAIGTTTKIVSWACATIIIGLNINLVLETVKGWISSSNQTYYIYIFVFPVLFFAAILLTYILIYPLIKQISYTKKQTLHGEIQQLELAPTARYKKIAITVDFSDSDSMAVNHAIAQGGKEAAYLLIHIVETAGAMYMHQEVNDLEAKEDLTAIEKYSNELIKKGFHITTKLGYGSPKKAIPIIVNQSNCDLLVMAAHGHKAIKDILLGTTLDAVRHHVNIPVLIVNR